MSRAPSILSQMAERWITCKNQPTIGGGLPMMRLQQFASSAAIENGVMVKAEDLGGGDSHDSEPDCSNGFRRDVDRGDLVPAAQNARADPGPPVQKPQVIRRHPARNFGDGLSYCQ